MNTLLRWFGFGESADKGHQRHGRGHDHSHDHGHGHTHGVVDPSIATASEGIRAVKISFLILVVTAVLQMVVVYLSGSVALLADTIHNVGDATTALPLWLAFSLARRKPTRTFNYGLGRVEDLAGIVIVLIIFLSAMVALYEAVDRLLHPQAAENLGWLAVAGLVGFAGNELVAVFRISVGRRINSAALIADGYHALSRRKGTTWPQGRGERSTRSRRTDFEVQGRDIQTRGSSACSSLNRCEPSFPNSIPARGDIKATSRGLTHVRSKTPPKDRRLCLPKQGASTHDLKKPKRP